MFNSLSEKISKAIDSLKGKSLITEKDFEEFTKVLRRALLEADVSLPVVKEFINNVREKVIGQKAIKNFSRADSIVKIIKDELVKTLSTDVPSNDNKQEPITDLNNNNINNSLNNNFSASKSSSNLNLNTKKPAFIMMVGLQGSGKTTTSAKLALYLKKYEKKNILLVSLDIYRPAAQKQLKLLADQIAVDILPIIEKQLPLAIMERLLEQIKATQKDKKSYDVVILDTAGRLHIDNELMEELKNIKASASPTEILLVVDSMIGQESVNVAKHFNEALQLTGLILTRLDSDTRGGAALSMKHATGTPIKFLGSGETINDFEKFHADRIANRILGMGDIVSLVERASGEISPEQIDSLKEKLSKGKFDFNDLLAQFKTVNKMGGIAKILKFLPGLNKLPINDMIDEKVMRHNLAMVHSMTKKERANPNLINQSRKLRIAKGAGVKILAVNKLMTKFEQARTMAMRFSKMGLKDVGNTNISDLFKN